jgi:hypothetical protein
MREALADLQRSKLATALAWLGAFTAALAVEVAFAEAAHDLRHVSQIGDLLHALLALLLGAAVGSLLFDIARSFALTAYAHPGQPFIALGLRRVPALITLTAVEATVQLFLLLGLLLALPRHAPLAAALLAAPVLCLLLFLFAAARVGLVLCARGVRPALALLHGFDVVARRFPSLLKLFLQVVLYTLPLTIPALALRLAAAFAHESIINILSRTLALALLELAALVGYAALGNFVGRDPRLTTG